MKNHYVKRVVAIVLTGAMLLSAGCSSSADKSADGKTQKDISQYSDDDGQKEITALVATGLSPDQADPIEGSMDFRLYEMVYDPLVRYGEDGKILPALAKKWEISEDGTKYTFYLRDDVKFSDGTNFNADSVLMNAERWIKDGFSSPLNNIIKIDDYTVEFEFESAAYPCLIEFTYPRPYRMAGAASFDENGKFVQMIGTGEWMVESYKEEQEVVMVPNPYYYGEKSKVDKVILRQVGDGQSRCMALQSGEADISIADIPSENKAVIEGDDTLDTFEVDGTLGFFLIENYENPMLQDVKVRQALNYAIDRQAIVDSLLDGAGTPATGLMTPNTPYVSQENSKGYTYNLDKAKGLLKEAGYEDGDGDGIVEKDGTPLSFRLVFQTEEYSNWKALCEFLQSEYAKAGIGIELSQVESASYYDAIWTTRDYDLIIYRTYEDSWNPHGFIKGMFYQAEGAKAVCWYDETLNSDILDVLGTMDERERQVKYDKIFKTIDGNALVVPLYYPGKEYVYNKRLTGLQKAPTTYEAVEWQFLDKAE